MFSWVIAKSCNQKPILNVTIIESSLEEWKPAFSMVGQLVSTNVIDRRCANIGGFVLQDKVSSVSV